MKVVWTQKAESSFVDIVEYLEVMWNVDIAVRFVDNVDQTIASIRKNPEMFKISDYDRVSRAAFITKHTTMFYRVLEDIIEIEFFWGNFDNPAKMEGLLSRK
jgi:plasmid stabilization system protein ParE